MRKILSESEKARKRRSGQLVIGVVLIILMLFSSVGYAFLNNTDSTSVNRVNYNGLDFSSDGYYWYFEKYDKEFITSYNPQDLEDEGISFSSSFDITDYDGAVVYYVGEMNEGIVEIDSNLNSYLLRSSRACIGECEEDLPIKGCVDNLIVFEESDNERIYQRDKCVFIASKVQNRLKYADAFLFDALGI
ncbi:hypothetical protein CMI42_04920 [Candidatus Pacearchaeota archaeon]|nr:hypothetical protein [Candidatus Pacearchaeota archaeon]|tara:strand:+ start:3088 stop:3657 length:570 start_codon:yes stop_codon:yes gene_type:complete